ncbi:MAG TPA: DUF6049 family protein [Streptosporangiaceae bacterium]
MRRPPKFRVGRALAALLAAAAAALPVTLLAGQASAAAATKGAGITVAITGLSQRWAVPGSTITVTGSLANHSSEPVRTPEVALYGSGTPIGSASELQQGPAGSAGLTGTRLARATWHDAGVVAPGAAVTWSIQLRTAEMGMTKFGVYPLSALALNAQGAALTPADTTYLPYVPSSRGAFHKSTPAPARIAWVWPLIDQPLLDQPFSADCSDPQASVLAQSLAAGGRLSGLVSAAGAVAAHDSLTWSIDPALLANVRALKTCTGSSAKLASVASTWLRDVQDATKGRPLFVTSYADVDAAALISHGHAADAATAYSVGQTVAGRILQHNVAPVAGQASSIDWPAGPVDYYTLENLVPKVRIQSVLLSSSAFPGKPTVVRTPGGQGNYVNVLLANADLTRLLGSATSAPGSAFASAQAVLAETALQAQLDEGQPIVAAPPQRWQPPKGLASDVLSATASAPWLSSAALSTLTTGQIPRIAPLAAGTPTAGGTPHTKITKRELRELNTLDGLITQQEGIRTVPDNNLYMALATVESSAWRGKHAQAITLLRTVLSGVGREASAVQIVADSRITLGGLKGSPPVSIDNKLGSPIRVRLTWQYSSSSGMRVSGPAGLVTVPARSFKMVKLKVQASQTGSTTISLRLVSASGQALPGTPARMTVQATEDGMLGLVVFACALGVVLFASALRAVRRSHPAPAVPAADETSDGGEPAAGPDTVVAEHSDLRAARPPAP